jgi:DNA-3-methyladenine glycosylase I
MCGSICPWALSSPLMRQYHDHEWGRPVHDDRALFEFLVLEGMQAGLSWEIVLKRREGMRAAFDDFDPAIVAAYGPDKIQTLLQDPALIRNRLKINAAVQNARAFLAVQAEYGSFDAFIRTFVGNVPLVNAWTSLGEIPAKTPESEAMSRALRKKGFAFAGPTICYAFMQATGMVNDHLIGCPARTP